MDGRRPRNTTLDIDPSFYDAVDGGDEVLNGKLDWVYQEEVYGRGTYRAYWWSPDSSRLAFLRLDEHGVPKYTLVDDISTRPQVESWHYPKAGDPNPKVQLLVARVARPQAGDRRHRQVLTGRSPHRGRGLAAGRRQGPLPGPGPRADLA